VRIVARHASTAVAQPLAHGSLLRAAAALGTAPHQIVVVADEPAARLVAAAHAKRPDLVAVATTEQARAWSAAGFTLFDGRTTLQGRPTAYDCSDFVCRLPVTDPAHV
jgi:uncharacterized protein YyaL (SSP411 family)